MENKKIPYLSNYNANIGGALGAFCHDLWMNPCEVLKQRLQMKNSPYINQSYARIANSIYRQEGLRAFYLSFGTQLSMNGMDFNSFIGTLTDRYSKKNSKFVNEILKKFHLLLFTLVCMIK